MAGTCLCPFNGKGKAANQYHNCIGIHIINAPDKIFLLQQDDFAVDRFFAVAWNGTKQLPSFPVG
jgi:hypothetical protein